MNHRRRILVLALSGAALAGTGWAGPLEPPPGPAAPTMKTLDEVEPRRPIHQSDLPLNIVADGSYYLAENLNANQNGVDMITVFGTTVSIDLMGFTIHGTSELAQAADCIEVNPAVRSFSLTNGHIRGCAGKAVTASGDTAATISRVQVTSNGEGIFLGGGSTFGVISGCVAKSNTGRGLVVNKGVIEQSVSVSNGSFGILLVSGVVRGCVSRDNVGLNISAGGVIADTYAP
jgi:predicted small lipoprotein YifL